MSTDARSKADNIEPRLTRLEADLEGLTRVASGLQKGQAETNKKIDELIRSMAETQAHRPTPWDKVLTLVSTGAGLFTLTATGIIWLGVMLSSGYQAKTDEKLAHVATATEMAVLQYRVGELQKQLERATAFAMRPGS